MATIFISYSRKDLKTKVALGRQLSKAGLSVWSDESIVAGDKYSQTIQRELDRAKAVVVLWSRSSIKSDYVCAEAEFARKSGKLIQVNTASLDPQSLPIPFNIRHPVPVNDFAQVIAAVGRLLWKSPEPLSEIATTYDHAGRPGRRTRPLTRIRVHLGQSGEPIDTELVRANSDALAFYGADRDRSMLIGLSIYKLVSRLSAWMDPEDFEALERDQIRAAAEFGHQQWAAARVPARLNSNHPNVRFRNRAFRPVVQTVLPHEDKHKSVLYAEVSYVEEWSEPLDEED
jgi:TIR domain